MNRWWLENCSIFICIALNKLWMKYGLVGALMTLVALVDGSREPVTESTVAGLFT